ncbi:LysR family transcriptional regulator [Salinisphaera sp. LB1]|uniref:LysR family transcriptional regulator n=1 Tax=Salinisphaera sp. LB1 TaxID=2183911 RepID=UPI000D7065E6|nr:LysR family transcriptional regulator [Salinisphaera sp. LB1]AWN15824.1 transcriptional regulator, LysR family [Salinisphaera sp. LB1]
MSTLDWEGLKTLALVCRGGTMSAAARELGVNQTTVARRLQRLEAQLGYSLLRRDGQRLRATLRADPLLQTARAMEDQLAATLIHTQAEPRRERITGVVRVTGVDGVLEYAVGPRVDSLLSAHPRLRLDLIGGNRNFRVAQREADIALRLARPTSGAFHARRLGDLAYGVYATATETDPDSAPWVDLNEQFIDKPEQQWLVAHFPDRRTIARGNRGGIMVQLALATGACCLMPRCIGDHVAGLHRLDMTPAGRELWLLTHQDMAHLPRVRVVADWLAATLCDGVTVTPA